MQAKFHITKPETEAGLMVMAACDLVPGELVLQKRCTFWVPINAKQFPYCHYCGEAVLPDEVCRCSDCDASVYCSKTCEESCGALHSLECPILFHISRIAAETGADEEILRALVREKARIALNTTPTEGDMAACLDLNELMCNEHSFPPFWRESLQTSLIKLHEIDATNILASVDDELRAAYRLKTHGLKIDGRQDDGLKAPMFAFFLELAALHHSCSPNCYFITEGTLLEVRAIKPVVEGEQLTVSYISIYAPREERHLLLRNLHHTPCQCNRCLTWELEDVINGFVCDACENYLYTTDDSGNVQENGLISAKTDLEENCEYVECVFCGHLNNLSDVHEARNALLPYTTRTQEVVHLLKCYEGINELEELLAAAQAIFHPHHHIFLRIRKVLYHAYKDLDDIPACKVHCEHIIQMLSNTVMPTFSLETAAFHFDLAALLMKLALNCNESSTGETSVTEIDKVAEHLKIGQRHQRMCTGNFIKVPDSLQKLEHLIQIPDNL